MPSLYLITDGEKLRSEKKLIPNIKACLEVAEGYVEYIQLREQKSLESASNQELEEIIFELLPIAKKFGAKLIINSNYQLALSSKVSGVHFSGKLYSEINSIKALNKNLVCGYSAHSLEDILTVNALPLDYILLAPIFPPLSKKNSVPTLGLAVLEQAVKRSKIPIYALGGIALENAEEVLQTGVDGLAMISSILLSKDPVRETRKFVRVIKGAEVC